MNELVSIIVPIYNVEKYLVECLESIVDQTYKNCEILLIDDGSTDQSYLIAKQFSESHPDKNIKLITKKNGGQSSARNSGMKKASGTYIVFIDSDDLVSSTHIEILYNVIKEAKVKLAMCKMTKNINDLSESMHENTEVLVGDFLTLTNKLYASKYPVASAGAKIYHHTILKDIEFYEGIIYEDGLFFYEVIDRVNDVALIDVANYYYRTTENSTMTSKIREKNFDILKQNELVCAFFEKNHPEAMSHFYRKALNANDYTAVKCLQDKGPLSKELMKKLYRQNKNYLKSSSLRNIIYLSWPLYYLFVFIVSKVFRTDQPDNELLIKKIIKKVTS